MVKSLFQLMLIVICTESIAQGEKKIEVDKLVKITETSDFSSLVKLAKYLSYEVLDSAKEANGSLIYITREKKINGNILGCTIDAKLRLNHLSFTTFNRETYDSLKKQIKNLGFKSPGISKGHFPEILESEDFEKGKMLISASSKKKDDNGIEYEFIFLKW